MRRIALYGKGGIGKSTLAANLSAAFGLSGLRVLQVGCDPKQDSTRLLLGGRTIGSALDYQRRTPPAARRLDAIVHAGYAGVSCVEAGGPEPGVGCAGRGILSTFDLLEQLGVERLKHDIILYDVLGDVVCGGFAVPLRDGYAEMVFIVTSGELMALYAANNILRGIRNYEGRGPRVGGICFNERKLEDEAERVERFARAVRLPIVARFPRSERFSEAEASGRTIVEAFPESALADRFHNLAAYVAHDAPRFSARPLTSGELEQVVHGNAWSVGGPEEAPLLADAEASRALSRAPAGPGELGAAPSLPIPPPKRYCSKGVRTQSVLFGCAFNGAVHTVTQIRDTSTLVHGPRSCAYLSSQGLVSAARRLRDHYGARFDRGAPRIRCSDMDEHTVIFGGNGALDDAVRQAAAASHGPLCVVTTCASGIIGDDARLVVKAARDENGGAPILLFPADGDITGDYMQGVLDAMRTVAEELVDPRIEPEGDAVNLVAEKNLAVNTEANFEEVQALLGRLGIRVNCRFIRRTTTAGIAGFKRARLSLLANDDAFGRVVRDFLMDHFGAAFASSPFPVGFQATADWLLEVARHFDRTGTAEAIIEQHRSAYRAMVARLRPELEGKRVFIAAQNHRIDWVLDTALDLGMEILKVGILESVWDDSFLSRYEGRAPIVYPYPREQRDEDMRALNPDLVLVNYPWRTMPESVRCDHVSVCPDVGFFTGVEAAARWSRLLGLPAREGWRRDV
jgi:nitrogenase iron protein